MDEVKLAEALDSLSLPELHSAHVALGDYIAHREAAAKAPFGAAAAPFDWGNFAKNFLKVVQAVWPVIAPLIGAAPK